MYPALLSTIRGDLDLKLIQQLNTRLEVVVQHAQSLDEKNRSIDARLVKSRSDLVERCQLRNNYYRRKLPLSFRDRCSANSSKRSLQLAEKQHGQSIQFYKKVFHIQSASNIDQYQQQVHQSTGILDDLRKAVRQYEEEIDRSKQQLIDQTNQLNLYSDRLFQIQYEQQQLRSNIEQLKRQIQLEQKSMSRCSDVVDLSAYHDDAQSSIEQFLKEYTYLCRQITEINVDIERKSIDLSALESDLPLLTTKANELIASKTRPLLLPITIKSEEINHPSILSVNQVYPQQQQLPSELHHQPEWVKCKSKKSKSKREALF